MARAGSFIGTSPRCSASSAANFATPSSYSSCHGCGRWDLMPACVVNTWESTEMRRSDTRPPDRWRLIVTTMARGVPFGNTEGASSRGYMGLDGDSVLTDGASLLYDPSSYALHEDPFPVYRRLQEAAPLYHNTD